MLNTSVFPKLCTLILCFLVIEGSVRMRNFEASKCVSDYDYILTLENVNMDIIDDEQMNLSGSMFVSTDLHQPLEARSKLYYKDFLIPVLVPCIDHLLGSCYYSDLCSFGYPDTEACPSQFQEDAVPCRCPITKGNYTLSPNFQLSAISHTGYLFIPGAYSGQINISSESKDISCYTFTFDLYDAVDFQDTNSIEQEMTT